MSSSFSIVSSKLWLMSALDDTRIYSLLATHAGPLGDDPQIAKSGELPPKALVRVDAIRKARLANLDCAQDCFFPKVEHPVHERPVCNLVVGRGVQAIAGNDCIPQKSLLAHLGNSRHRKRLGDWQIVEGGAFISQLPPAEEHL